MEDINNDKFFTNNLLYDKIDDVFSYFPTNKYREPDGVFLYNFLGGKVRKISFIKGGFGDFTKYFEWNATLMTSKNPRYALSEDYFEWVDMLTSLKEASGQFNFLKLGSQTGRWEAFAAIANNAYKKLPCHFVSVDKARVGLIFETFEDNGICKMDNIRHDVLRCSVSDVTSPFVNKETLTKAEKNSLEMSLDYIIDKFEGKEIDLIDSDCQGPEGHIFHASRDKVNKYVKRVHIGTHSSQIDKDVFELFSDMGWKNINNFGWGEVVVLPQGKMSFMDGIQTWVNPNLCKGATND